MPQLNPFTWEEGRGDCYVCLVLGKWEGKMEEKHEMAGECWSKNEKQQT